MLLRQRHLRLVRLTTSAVRDFTTRKHYPGDHLMELIVNGEVLAEGGFELRG